MPHVKQRCTRCRGSGRALCQICGGSGQVFKGQDIHGTAQYDRCSGCFGNKSARCNTCGGEGWA